MAQDGPVYGKFYVSRTDGRDQPGCDKEGAMYFVLDYKHDLIAREALAEYARCAEASGFTQLGKDLKKRLKDVNK